MYFNLFVVLTNNLKTVDTNYFYYKVNNLTVKFILNYLNQIKIASKGIVSQRLTGVHLQFWKRSKQAASHATLIRITKELSIQVFVSGQCYVIRLSNSLKSFIKNFYIGICHAADTVIAELFKSNRAITYYKLIWKQHFLKIILPSTSIVLN